MATMISVLPVMAVSSGSVLRVGVMLFQQSFQWQRITDPTSGLQWTTWNTFSGGSGNIFQDGGCAISRDQGTVNAYCQQGTGGNALWNWYSNDGGQTWSGPGGEFSPPGSALIKGISSAGNADVFSSTMSVAAIISVVASGTVLHGQLFKRGHSRLPVVLRD